MCENGFKLANQMEKIMKLDHVPGLLKGHGDGKHISREFISPGAGWRSPGEHREQLTSNFKDMS